MSLAHTIRDAERRHPEYGFFIALVCLALGVLIASALFTPEAVGSGISTESLFIGP